MISCLLILIIFLISFLFPHYTNYKVIVTIVVKARGVYNY